MKPNLTNPGKVVITIATTGGLHGKEANPALPEQPDEIVRDFYDCYNAGAAVAHIHVRDAQGRTCSDLSVYHEVVDGVMSRCPGMISQVGNGIGIWFDDQGRGQPFTQEERMALLDITPQPDMLTVNAGTFHFDHKGQEWLFSNSKQWNAEFIEGCKYRGIANEIEVYDLSHIANALELAEKGILPAPPHFSFVMGIRGGIPATPANLLAMLDAVPEGSSWQIVSIGKHQLPLSTMAAAMGGNVRVGMEDNVYYGPGVLAQSNAQLVERAVRIVRELGREVASPEEAREMLHIARPPQAMPAP
ncbi:MAG: 3-keto-5-aminohexanoate cleavage protein [Kiloniellaceae bacterium]